MAVSHFLKMDCKRCSRDVTLSFTPNPSTFVADWSCPYDDCRSVQWTTVEGFNVWARIAREVPPTIVQGPRGARALVTNA